MDIEIERKFRVRDDSWRAAAEPGVLYVQGYLSTDPARCVRVRVAGATSWLTIKGAGAGASRAEFEYPIPREDALEMLRSLCPPPLVEKVRHRVSVGDHVWEVDVFEGANAGLVIAEIELDAEDEVFVRPAWAGLEVTTEGRYYNAALARQPFSTWGDAER